MNFIKNPIKSNISFLELIKECEDNFYLKPSSPKTEIIKKKFLNYYKKKIKKNNGPLICEVFTSENQSSLFKQGYKEVEKGKFEPQPLSEMFPFFSSALSNTNN